ncbi:MAG: DUF202 domain-containing protein [Candidatus Micrarchaeota archaeon]
MPEEKKLDKIRTNLAEERTELAWQRNRLSEMSVLMGVVGLGFLITRFFAEFWVAGVLLSSVGGVWLAIVVFHYFTQKNRMRCS